MLILPLVWEFVARQAGAGGRRKTGGGWLRDWLALGLPVVAVGTLLGWSRLALGNPLAFIATQAEWNRRFSWPWETVVYAWNEATRQPFSFQVESQSWTYFATLVLFGVLTVAGWRVLRGPHSLYLTLGVLFPLFSGTPLNPLLSFPRFMLVLFPAFIVLAVAGRFRPIHYGILLTGTLLLAFTLSASPTGSGWRRVFEPRKHEGTKRTKRKHERDETRRGASRCAPPSDF